MATYLQNVTDTGIAPIQFTPNFPYMQQALQSATSRYETNFSKMASGATAISSAELSNAKNIEARDNYTAQIQTNLEKLAKSDLSIQGNVDQANKLFAPFWEDNDILYDYKTTKDVKTQIQQAYELQNSSDKDERARFWQAGVDYAGLTLKELQLANRGDGSIAKVRSRKYVPFVNIQAEMDKWVKDNGFTVKTTSVGNGYITEYINGEGSKKTYEDVAARLLNENPQWRDVFKVQGTVQFYGSVLNYQQQYGVDEATARHAVAQNYQQAHLNTAQREIERIRPSVELLQKEYDDIVAKTTQKGDPDPNTVKEMTAKYSALQSAKAGLDYYKNQKSEFEGDDFISQVGKTGGEAYFSKIFEQSFIKDFARIHASHVETKITSDPTRIAAESQANALRIAELRADDNQWIDTDGDGIADAKVTRTVGANGNLMDTVNIGTAKNTLKGKSQTAITAQQALDTPSLGPVFGKQGSASSNVSYYDNYKNAVKEKGNSFTEGGAQFITAVPGFFNKYTSDGASMSQYVQWLTAAIKGDKSKMTSFSDDTMKATHAKLRADGVLPESMDDYRRTPTLQLKSLVDAASNYARTESSNKQLTEQQIALYRQYEQDGRTYYYGNKLLKEVNDKIIGTDPTMKLLAEQGSAGYLKQYIQNSPAVRNFVAGKYVNMNAPVKDATLSTDKLIDAYINGKIQYRKSGLGNDYITIDGVEYASMQQAGPQAKITNPLVVLNGLKKEAESKLVKHSENLNRSVEDYISKQVIDGQSIETTVMSKELQFRTDNDNNLDVANKIVTNVLGQANLPRLDGENGVVRPLNWEDLTDGADGDNVRDLLRYLTQSGGENLNKVITSTGIAMAGADGQAVARFYVDSKKIVDLLKGTDFEKYKDAITTITRSGIELPMGRDDFRTFALDNYIPKAIDKAMLKDGIKASDWEKDNLHYDYAVQEGADGGYAVTMKLLRVDPATKTESWVDMDEAVLFPKNYPINEILKTVHQLGYNNYRSVSGYYKQQRQNVTPATAAANPFALQPGETIDQYKKRTQALISQD